jgi:tetrapyrrole methylase family protein/MazG family protein
VQNLGSFATLRYLVARLRSPEGCPWDREQTHSSIKHNLLEECYEAVEALDEEDMARLLEELGDMSMLVVFHAQMAEEAGEFTMEDVLSSINAKLLRRHPHVFGNLKIENTQDLLAHWEAIKRSERGEEASLLSTVPKAMPALSYSRLIQERAARVGFDWPQVAGVLEKLGSEVRELAQAADKQRQLEEFGDVLFSLVNVARWMGIDPEEALRLANQKFRRRFGYMEEVWIRESRSPKEMTLDELDALWDEAKRLESGGLEPPNRGL